MNRRGRSDVIVVGGGVVGAACALALYTPALPSILGGLLGFFSLPMSSEQADETCIANSRKEIFFSHRGRGVEYSRSSHPAPIHFPGLFLSSANTAGFPRRLHIYP